ncbi:c-type cytochrome [Paraburkholderia sp. HP33-1]|uniref:c-type cytochrome n=1 Tax=Paraburkholderia sp. HP33-1 TaxID=2883243 RepID=UPI001F3AE104|nr:c-type cytochrome [Paraburkholderia sp. HP33-1]
MKKQVRSRPLIRFTVLLAATGAISAAAAASTTAAPPPADLPNGLSQRVMLCAGCHGANGTGNDAAGFPRLAGVGVTYLKEQLDAFASGQRESEVMQPVAQMLSADERTALSQYFSALPAVTPASTSAPVVPAQPGAWLAERGRWSDGLPACTMCHGPGGAGVGEHFPPLAGQPAAYLSNQLHAWKDGRRPAGPLGLMSVIAKKLSDADIAAVAAYYGAHDSSAQPSAGKEAQ